MYIVVSIIKDKTEAEGVSEWDAEKAIRPKREKVTEALVNFIMSFMILVLTKYCLGDHIRSMRHVTREMHIGFW